MPDLEARAAVSLKLGDITGTVGVGYHTEQREYQTAATAAAAAVVQDEITTNLVGVDADINLTKFLQVKGEYYTGSGADDTYFGIAPSVSGTPTNRDTVDSTGFWAQALIKPSPLLTLTAGYGQASGDEDIITANTARQENSQLAFGAIVNAGKAWRFGVEYIMTDDDLRQRAGRRRLEGLRRVADRRLVDAAVLAGASTRGARVG